MYFDGSCFEEPFENRFISPPPKSLIIDKFRRSANRCLCADVNFKTIITPQLVNLVIERWRLFAYSTTGICCCVVNNTCYALRYVDGCNTSTFELRPVQNAWPNEDISLYHNRKQFSRSYNEKYHRNEYVPILAQHFINLITSDFIDSEPRRASARTSLKRDDSLFFSVQDSRCDTGTCYFDTDESDSDIDNIASDGDNIASDNENSSTDSESSQARFPLQHFFQKTCCDESDYIQLLDYQETPIDQPIKWDSNYEILYFNIPETLSREMTLFAVAMDLDTQEYIVFNCLKGRWSYTMENGDGGGCSVPITIHITAERICISCCMPNVAYTHFQHICNTCQSPFDTVGPRLGPIVIDYLFY